jgi:integrase
MGYLERLPGAMQGKSACRRGKDSGMHLFAAFAAGDDGDAAAGCREPIESVQDLLDHKHITTTQIYDKRRRSVRDSASHKVPI